MSVIKQPTNTLHTFSNEAVLGTGEQRHPPYYTAAPAAIEPPPRVTCSSACDRRPACTCKWGASDVANPSLADADALFQASGLAVKSHAVIPGSVDHQFQGAYFTVLEVRGGVMS